MSTIQSKLEAVVTGLLTQAMPRKANPNVLKFAIAQHLLRYTKKRYKVWYDAALPYFGTKAAAVKPGTKAVIYDDVAVTIIATKTEGGEGIDADRLLHALRELGVPEAKLSKATKAATVAVSPQLRIETVLKL